MDNHIKLTKLKIKRMVNRNTKYWFFTWEGNAAQRKLPSKEKLKAFLDQIADYGQFLEHCV